ncbi:MAG: 23S rRNA (guanosine(2251)-2'-O)-methyltransferase RlmB [Acidobacteria bacterium]|nr:MAG: 23S rRNA (guanosine(2251)-2'-O)-methyltransferase RlmB [Acidobacteriota bacterium]
MPLIYGVNTVNEALKARKVARVIHARGAGARVDAILDRARELRIPVETSDNMHLERLCRGGVHQGVAAELQEMAAYTVDELIESAALRDEAPLLVILDSIEDPQNVGAILRTANGAGVHGVIRQARHAARLDGATAKASAGAVNHLQIATVVNISRTIEELKERNIWTIGFDGSATDSYADVDYTLPTAIVLGAEGDGLRRLVRESCDRLVRIPMLGEVESLNVSVAAGVALYEAVRQRGKRGT